MNQKNVTEFNDLVFENYDLGKYCRVYFDNGYGASIVIGEYTYGGRNGLYEIAILDNEGITYDTPITSDVIGYLSEDEVSDYLKQIKNLEPNE